MLPREVKTILKLWGFVPAGSCKLALRNGAINIIMIAVPESVEYKKNLSSALKNSP